MWTNTLSFLWGFCTNLLTFVIQTIKLILNTLDTFYDFTVDMTESNNAMYQAISPCQSCYSLNSSPCRCSKYLYCDILCQVNIFIIRNFPYSLLFQIADGHQCNIELTFDDNKDPKEVFQCDLCGFTFNSQKGVRIHKASLHKSSGLRLERIQA